PSSSPPFPYTTLFRSRARHRRVEALHGLLPVRPHEDAQRPQAALSLGVRLAEVVVLPVFLRLGEAFLRLVNQLLAVGQGPLDPRSEEHTSELQSRVDL